METGVVLWERIWAIMMLFVGVPAGWALIWAFCVAVDKWRHKR